MASKIIYWLLVALILSLGFGQLLRFEFFGLPLYLHDLFTLALLPLLLLSKPVRKFPPWVWLIAGGLVLGWLRAFFLFPTSILLIPSLYTFRLVAYLLLYLLLSARSVIIPRRIYLLSALTTIVLGLSQYLLYPDMRLFQYLGWDDHLFRLTLPHFDPAFTGSMIILSLLSLHPVHRYLYPIAIFAVLMTYARAVWLSLGLSLIGKIKDLRILLNLLLLALIILWLLPNRFGEGTNLLRTYSISDRLTHDFQLISKVGTNFLSGQGYNTLPLIFDSTTSRPEHAASFNNSFLTILATMGILGLLGFGKLFQELKSRYPQSSTAIAFLLISSFFNNLLLYPFALLWILVYYSTRAPTSV